MAPPPEAPRERVAAVYLYDANGVVEHAQVAFDAIDPLLDEAAASGRRIWIDIECADRPAVVAALARRIRLHPITEELLLSRDHRTSVDEFPEFAHLIIELAELGQTLRFEKVDMLLSLGDRPWLVTVQDHPGDCFGTVRERLRASPTFRSMAPAYLMHALCESACREYLRILRKFGQRLEQLEAKLIAKPVPGLLQRIHAARRDLRAFRRAVVPLRESIESLSFGPMRGARDDPASAARRGRDADLAIALREIHDELGSVMDVLEAHTDAVRNLSELYLTSVSNRVNEILRVLTIISTIFIPLSFVAGVYGMNFEHMPELRWRWGYPAILLVMGAMAGGMLLFFARRGWLRKSDMPRLPSITRPTPFFDEPAKPRDAAPASASDRPRTPPP